MMRKITEFSVKKVYNEENAIKEAYAMKKYSLYGKITLLLGVLFILGGGLLFIQNVENTIVWKEQTTAIAFLLLGIALFIVPNFLGQTKQYEQTKGLGE